MRPRSSLTFRDYGTGHCWYYLLGGAVLTPKQIKAMTQASGYLGYARDYILEADRKAEPQRSAALRALKERFEGELHRDLAGYRKSALYLRRYRVKNDVPTEPTCAAGVHVAISLKHNHLVNDFAHLIWLDKLLTQQGDLFGFLKNVCC